MTNYDIVEGYSISELKERVNNSISKGFIPIGNFVIDENDDYYKQTMFNPEIQLERVEI